MPTADIDGNDIVVKTEFRDKDLIRLVAGARWDAHEYVWRLPLSWPGCIALRGVFRERLTLGPTLREWAFKFKSEFMDPSLALRDLTDAEGDADLYKFQRAGVAWMTHVQTGILMDEMGTGKTVQTIRTFVKSIRDSRVPNPFPALIVCPNTVKGTWEREFEKWWPGVRCVMLDGSRAARLKAITEVQEGRAHVLIANWESLRGHSRLAPYGSIRLKHCMVCDPILRGEIDVAQENMDAAQRDLDRLNADAVNAAEAGDDDDVAAERERLATLLLEATQKHKDALRKHGPQTCERCPRELNDITFTTIVADEAHRMKDPMAKQTRALFAIASKPETRLRYALTGTPIADAPDDLWSALHFIDPKAWPVRGKYVDRYCLTTFNPFGGMTVIGLKPETRDEFFTATDPYTRRMPKSVVLRDLPPKVYLTRYTEMSPKQQKAYRAMKQDMIAHIEDTGHGNRVTAINPLTQLIRLSQFASSYATLEEDMVRDPQTGAMVPKVVVRLADPSNKVDGLLEIASELNGEPAGVFAQSRQLIELTSKRFEKYKIRHVKIVGGQSAAERMAAIDEFQRGKVPFVLATVGAGGIGITLTRGRTCIFAQRSWSMIENAQAEDRFHRIGSEIHESINIVDLVTPGTIEVHQRQALDAKGDRMQEITRDDELFRRMMFDD